METASNIEGVSGKTAWRWARCPWCTKLERVPLNRTLHPYLAELGCKLGDPTRAWHNWCLKVYLKTQGVWFHEDDNEDENI